MKRNLLGFTLNSYSYMLLEGVRYLLLQVQGSNIKPRRIPKKELSLVKIACGKRNQVNRNSKFLE